MILNIMGCVAESEYCETVQWEWSLIDKKVILTVKVRLFLVESKVALVVL